MIPRSGHGYIQKSPLLFKVLRLRASSPRNDPLIESRQVNPVEFKAFADVHGHHPDAPLRRSAALFGNHPKPGCQFSQVPRTACCLCNLRERDRHGLLLPEMGHGPFPVSDGVEHILHKTVRIKASQNVQVSEQVPESLLRAQITCAVQQQFLRRL